MGRIEEFAKAFPDLEITEAITKWVAEHPREAWTMIQIPRAVAVEHGIGWLRRHGRLPNALYPYLWYRANQKEGIKGKTVSAFNTIRAIIIEAAELKEIE